MKVTVNKSPYTGQLFECNREYRRHMDDQRVRKQTGMAAELSKDAFDQLVREIQHQPSFDEITAAVSSNYWMIANQSGFRCNLWAGRYKKPGLDDAVTIELARMEFKECSTSHSAPMGQSTTGWTHRGSSYKEWGWEGTIYVKFAGEGYEFFDSDQLSKVGINTGSGGGGPSGLRYGVTLFAKDFPTMRRREVLDKMAQ